MSNTSVACPGEAVLFTCSLPGLALQWRIDPSAESELMSVVQSEAFLSSSPPGQRDTLRSGVIMFEAVFVSNDGGTLTSTLINLSEVSVLDDSNVTCTVTVSGGMPVESHQTIIVAGEYHLSCSYIFSSACTCMHACMQLLQPLQSTQECHSL